MTTTLGGAGPTRTKGRRPTAASSPGRRAPEAVALQWRVIHDPARRGRRNMALDHALAERAEAKHAVLRLYRWERPTVSFGKNEPAADLYSAHAAAGVGVDVVRRPTGGRAVLHADELTYSVVAPVQSLGGVRVAYRRINHALALGLRALGADVAVSEAADPLPLDAGPCFQSPAEGEVVASGRKLVGSAQARIGGALLQHGSIILSGDQSLLTEISKSSQEHAGPASLKELVGDVSIEDVASAVTQAASEVFGGTWSGGEYAKAEIDAADRLEGERYGRDSWTWRC